MATPQLSYEFFPPRNEAQTRRFWRTVGCLETIQADWFSMTYGALGSASQASLDTVAQLSKDSKTPVAAHLTCAGQTQSELLEVLNTLQAMSVEHIVALRGDNVSDAKDGKYYHLRYASELVELIAQSGQFDISVAAYPEVHPEAASAESDMEVLKHKLDAGASRALTQFFFEPEVFLRWRDSAIKAGIDKPLIREFCLFMISTRWSTLAVGVALPCQTNWYPVSTRRPARMIAAGCPSSIVLSFAGRSKQKVWMRSISTH